MFVTLTLRWELRGEEKRREEKRSEEEKTIYVLINE